jgi:hypothetical protein
MDEVLVDVVKAKLLQLRVEGGIGVLDCSAGDFGSDVQFVSRNAGLFDCCAELCFISVD